MKQKEDTSRELDTYDDADCDWTYVYEPSPQTSTPNLSTRNGIRLESWMAHISSDLPLSRISIPGSHESCAKLPVPWVQCQPISIESQLSTGIRYFDFRLGVAFSSLRLYHGRSPLGFTLAEVLAHMYAFLDKHPSEALMLQVKMEGGNGNEETFEQLLRAELEANTKHWALGNTIPTLGMVRGKIQLVRRFRIAAGDLGIDVRRWADNSARFWIPIAWHDRLVVQDQYEYTNVVPTFPELIKKKVGAINNLIAEANDPSSRAWHLNWCNAFAGPFSWGVVATPSDIALGRDKFAGVNESLHEMISRMDAKRRVGTILLDFIDAKTPDLITEIIMSNDFLDT